VISSGGHLLLLIEGSQCQRMSKLKPKFFAKFALHLKPRNVVHIS